MAVSAKARRADRKLAVACASKMSISPRRGRRQANASDSRAANRSARADKMQSSVLPANAPPAINGEVVAPPPKQLIALSGDFPLDDKSQKAAKLWRMNERLAGKNPVEMARDRLGRKIVDSAPRSDGTPGLYRV